MSIVYDTRFIHPHGDRSLAKLFLMNEAPGPSEAQAGIPSFGRQGCNIFHSFRAAGISWAVAHQKFKWPTSDSKQHDRNEKKSEFLTDRSNHITCTNSYPFWPRPNLESNGFCAPLDDDVKSKENIERIRAEISPAHSAIFICGTSAYLACIGEQICNPKSRECTELNEAEMLKLNSRLAAKFEIGWYMGHTRRWLMRKNKTVFALRQMASFMGWSVEGGD